MTGSLTTHPGRSSTSASAAHAVRYAVVSAIRNEEEYIEQTAGSLAAQSIVPSRWLIVDDGSSDRTPAILADLAKRFDWVRVLPLGELGGSNRCSRVMRAFLTGYRALAEEFDYVIKIDGDVTFEPDHVQRLLAHFDEDPRLGIASGTYTEPAGQGWRVFTLPEGYAVGALRAYRAECLSRVVAAVQPMLNDCSAPHGRASRGRDLTLSWDSIDHLYAESEGWKTHCFHELVMVHHRTEGGRSHVLKGLFEQGVVSWVMGYHPLYAFARGVFKMREYPYVVGGAALTWGYLWGGMQRVARADDRTRSLVRGRQMSRVRRAIGLGDRAGAAEDGVTPGPASPSASSTDQAGS